MTAPSRWKQYLALVLLALLASWMIFDWARFKGDFWPPDRSFVGPNLLASLVQAGFLLIVLALIYPPTRHWLERAIESHARELKEHVEADNAKIHDALAEKLSDLHDCMDEAQRAITHIIVNSPDDIIPPLPEKSPQDTPSST